MMGTDVIVYLDTTKCDSNKKGKRSGSQDWVFRYYQVRFKHIPQIQAHSLTSFRYYQVRFKPIWYLHTAELLHYLDTTKCDSNCIDRQGEHPYLIFRYYQVRFKPVPRAMEPEQVLYLDTTKCDSNRSADRYLYCLLYTSDAADE